MCLSLNLESVVFVLSKFNRNHKVVNAAVYSINTLGALMNISLPPVEV